MSVSIVDGTLEAVELRRKARHLSVFNLLLIRRVDGSEQRVSKAVVAAKVAEALKPGASGRFYLYRSIDQKGVHGVRLADGTSLFDYPKLNERLMLMVLIVNCILLVGRLALEGRIWLFALALIVFAAIVYPLYRRTHMEARDQFDADKGFTPQR
jgi:hypothetical protein